MIKDKLIICTSTVSEGWDPIENPWEVPVFDNPNEEIPYYDPGTGSGGISITHRDNGSSTTPGVGDTAKDPDGDKPDPEDPKFTDGTGREDNDPQVGTEESKINNTTTNTDTFPVVIVLMPTRYAISNNGGKDFVESGDFMTDAKCIYSYDQKILIGCGDGKIWRSTDFGATFVKIYDDATTQVLQISCDGSNYVFRCNNKIVFSADLTTFYSESMATFLSRHKGFDYDDPTDLRSLSYQGGRWVCLFNDTMDFTSVGNSVPDGPWLGDETHISDSSLEEFVSVDSAREKMESGGYFPSEAFVEDFSSLSDWLRGGYEAYKWSTTSHADPGPPDGYSAYSYFEGGSTGSIQGEQSLFYRYFNVPQDMEYKIDLGELQVKLFYKLRTYNVDNVGRTEIIFWTGYNGTGTQLAAYEDGYKNPYDMWHSYTNTQNIPAGTRCIQFVCNARNNNIFLSTKPSWIPAHGIYTFFAAMGSSIYDITEENTLLTNDYSAVVVGEDMRTYRSSNMANWMDVSSTTSGVDFVGVKWHPTTSRFVALAKNKFLGNAEIMYSADFGLNWSLQTNILRSIPECATSDNTLLAEANRRLFIGNGKWLAYSDDGAQTWANMGGFSLDVVGIAKLQKHVKALTG